ncbi:MAG: hypothetical protein JXR91_17100 [Deltaproteobacteria bacterium]|nr:hypothetical protein [Deltaproteobacteria bacterium]
MCGTLEYCNVQEGCIPTGDECAGDKGCNDGIDCTIDYCELGTCSNIPDHSKCSNSKPFCLETPLCNPDKGGCIDGKEIVCDQPKSPCMSATCNDSNGECDISLMTGADDDNDSFYDEDCGGDDCDDNNDAIYPGAIEKCNGKDNNCDSIKDISYNFDNNLSLYKGNNLSNPQNAFNGTDNGVIFFDGSVIKIIVADSSGKLVSTEPFVLSSLVTDSDKSIVPSITGTDTGFIVAWVSKGISEAVNIASVYKEGDTLKGTLEKTITMGANESVTGLSLKYSSSGATPGWSVAYALNTTSTGNIYFLNQSGSSPFAVDSQTGTATGVSLIKSDTDSFLITYWGNFTLQSGSDVEMFESVVKYDTDFSNDNGFPRGPFSPVDSDGVQDTDPSQNGKSALSGAGKWITVYEDSNGYSSGITAWNSDKQLNQSLINPTGLLVGDVSFLNPATGFTLVYSSDTLVTSAVEFSQYNSDSDDTLKVTSKNRLIYAEDKNSERVSDPSAATALPGEINVVWIFNGDNGQDILQLANVGTCQQ